jgi:hypothetical protein
MMAYEMFITGFKALMMDYTNVYNSIWDSYDGLFNVYYRI